MFRGFHFFFQENGNYARIVFYFQIIKSIIKIINV